MKDYQPITLKCGRRFYFGRWGGVPGCFAALATMADYSDVDALGFVNWTTYTAKGKRPWLVRQNCLRKVRQLRPATGGPEAQP